MASCPAELPACVAAVYGAYEGLWADFLRNRMAQAGERARALLQILDTIPEAQKDGELWVTEADFCYIAGAAGGNDPELLCRALACYTRTLALSDAMGSRLARRMHAETLLRLFRYEEAFEAFGELAKLRDEASLEQLEAAPFRLRHDALLCERLAALGRLSAEAAGAAATALRAVAARVESSPLSGGRQRWPQVVQLKAEERAELRVGLFGELAHRSSPYPEARLRAWTGSSSEPTRVLPDPLGASVDWARAEQEYLTEKITIVDDFFSVDALDELWTYSQEAPCFCTVRNGFLGAFPADGNIHPLIIAAARSLEKRMPNVMKGHPLGIWWFFKYTEAGRTGIGIHADAAAVNMNIWLTPDAARRKGGGLDVYTEVPPVEANGMEINREFATEEDEAKFRDKLLHAGGVRHVDYKRNRAVIFMSDLYHASQPFEFPDPEQPRVNLTLLFGDRAVARTTTQKEVAAGAAGKRPREEEDGWDLFD